MPRVPMNDEEIEKTRNNILDHALDIIGKDGYDSLTMRKLGSRLGFAAKTIYNYYSCKEEIYICVLTRGFEELNGKAEKAIADVSDPLECLRILIRTYIEFGTGNANYYNIMFNWDVPKFSDYVGTVLEPLAHEEKTTAFRFAEIARQVLIDLIPDENAADEEVTYQILRLWSELHGIVSLCNSHGMNEFDVDISRFMERVTEEVISRFQ